MKPLYIRMKNVGPYLDETIDFSQLDNLFLIKGDTGAGKTYIFDAMTFALYGALSGNRSKRGVNIRNRDIPDEEEDVFVEFTFMSGEEIYRVKRNVAGGIPTFEKKDSDSGKFVTLSQKNKTEINKSIQNVIGLELNEFSQVVLLPQGQFSEFLHKNSNDRTGTLEKIFPITDYSKLVATVEKRYDAENKEIKNLNSVLASEQNEYDFTDADKKIEDMKEEISKLNGEKKKLNDKIIKLSNKETEYSNKMAAAKSYEDNCAALEEMDASKEKINDLDDKVKLADSAVSLKTYLDAKNTAAKHVDEANDSLTQIEEELGKIQKKFDGLKEKEASMKKLKTDLDEKAIEISKIKDMLEKAKKLSDLETAKNNAEKERDAASDEVSKLNNQISKESEVLKNKKVSVLIEEENTSLEAIKTEISETTTALEAAKKIVEIESTISRNNENKQKVEDDRTESVKRAAESKKKIQKFTDSINNFKDENSAYSLSLLLKPGCNCPVCGSKEHPLIAEKPNGAFDLEGVTALLEEEQKNFEYYNNAISNCDSVISGIKSTIQNNDEQLKELKKTKGLDKVEVLESKLAALNTEKKNAETQKQTWIDLQETLDSLNSSLTSAKENYNTLNNKYTSANTEYEAAKKEVNGKSEEELRKECNEAESKYNSDKTDYEIWKTDFDSTSSKKTSKDSEIKAYRENISKFMVEKNEAVNVLTEKISKSNFENEAALSAAVMDSAELEANRKTVSDFREKYKSTADAIKNATVKEKSADIKVELDNLEEEIGKAKTALTELEEKISAKTSEENLYSTNWEKINRHYKELKVLQDKIAPLERLYNDVTGLKNSLKIRYDAWALGMYFEEILLYASERFKAISNNKYSFQLKDVDGKSKGRGYKGLDLLVRDNTNGKVFDACELSGGETFEASISLALAITDVVKNNSGGVNLDSLFIDEGFGTLDPDTLEKAMHLFHELGEHKMVGVISHVEGLESEIPSYLMVKKGIHGSKVSVGNIFTRES